MKLSYTRSRLVAVALFCVSAAVFTATFWHQHETNRFAENQATFSHANTSFNFLAAAYGSPDNSPDDDLDEPTPSPTLNPIGSPIHTPLNTDPHHPL